LFDKEGFEVERTLSGNNHSQLIIYKSFSAILASKGINFRDRLLPVIINKHYHFVIRVNQGNRVVPQSGNPGVKTISLPISLLNRLSYQASNVE